MHSAYFVKVSKDVATNSEEARANAQQSLDDNGFAAAGGYFSSARADWYVIGGRWSGTLTRELKSKEYKEFTDEAEKEIAKYPNKHHHDPETLAINHHLLTPELTDYLNALYQAKLGTSCTFTRDTYIHEGYDDDAAIITPELREALNKQYGEVEVFDAAMYEEKKVSELTKDDDGDWLVVIDYHS